MRAGKLAVPRPVPQICYYSRRCCGVPHAGPLLVRDSSFRAVAEADSETGHRTTVSRTRSTARAGCLGPRYRTHQADDCGSAAHSFGADGARM